MKQRLKDRSERGALRKLKPPGGVDFISNDYLGYSRLELPETGLPHGSTGSRLLSGNHKVFGDTEDFMAGFFGAESSLLFNSGYTANLGLISALSDKESLFIYDAYSHASVRDGLRMGFGRHWHYEHNDLDHLESLLQKASEGVFVVTESVFSMDGDEAPLKEIADLCERYGAKLIVDEAHSGGIFGRQGRGSCEEAGICGQVFARVFTFGKAFGRHGAVVVGSGVLREYLINFSRPFIYSTAMSPHEVEQLRMSVEYRSSEESEVDLLRRNIEYWNRRTGSLIRTPIRIIPVSGGNEVARTLEKKIAEAGYRVPAILSPTVAPGRERLRICLHSFNTETEMQGLLKAAAG
ncbi:MAG: aminotransferase class I/II-fold pyridoxal phosphate-dependent enzyme [Bacteroidia bacterium]|nr:aminotransferase class I/II-fold pyridoxal phosphate-dependent enzyme [Bacteroidia bacterium]